MNIKFNQVEGKYDALDGELILMMKHGISEGFSTIDESSWKKAYSPEENKMIPFESMILDKTYVYRNGEKL